nr:MULTISPECIES: hypothetical protein [Gluconobacter]
MHRKRVISRGGRFLRQPLFPAGLATAYHKPF